jgi:hypothetical protein
MPSKCQEEKKQCYLTMDEHDHYAITARSHPSSKGTMRLQKLTLLWTKKKIKEDPLKEKKKERGRRQRQVKFGTNNQRN